MGRITRRNTKLLHFKTAIYVKDNSLLLTCKFAAILKGQNSADMHTNKVSHTSDSNFSWPN